MMRTKKLECSDKIAVLSVKQTRVPLNVQICSRLCYYNPDSRMVIPMKQCVSCKTHNVFTKGVYGVFETFACHCAAYHVHWAQELTIADSQQTTRRNDPPRGSRKDPGIISSSWDVEHWGFQPKVTPRWKPRN
ncbi:hypothetical protein K0M31_020376 [Melipona bicolor]|uniref:Uncharacterized protein n=1 Tax=Melipona bicolor TaxID=60889 RepID=A0AA40G1X7_9HYME|nr:hypothetical protein K0M31_020376 [Melipona bicolor]